MGNKKLIVNGGNKSFSIKDNKSFCLKDSVYTPVVPEAFLPYAFKSAFQSFVPQIQVDYINQNKQLKVANISDIKPYLDGTLYTYKNNPYSTYLEVGIILTKHHIAKTHSKLNSDYELLDLPKGAIILWNRTTYGRTDNPGMLTFTIDLDTGYIKFKDYEKTNDPNQKWSQVGSETNNCLIFNKIYPVPTKEVNPTTLYRGQDMYHNYYFYGLVFRLKEFSAVKSLDSYRFCLTQKSPLSIAVSYDTNTGNINTLPVNGYTYIDMLYSPLN